MTRDAYCSYCGTTHPAPLVYPRRCPNPACGREVWANPIPVVVVLVPVGHEARLGLLVVRRGIEPQRGKLALVGGFVLLFGAAPVLEARGIHGPCDYEVV